METTKTKKQRGFAMFGECHAHLLMDGSSYKAAVIRHKERPHAAWIQDQLLAYQKAGVTFIRDGGDHLGVSLLAAKIAVQYGIDYRTPAFAIHKNGHYGAIVGRGFDTLKEYRALVCDVKKQQGDFIKIMTTGIMDFDNAGHLTSPGLPSADVEEMVHIAHTEGFGVMVHVNGADNVKIAIEAGVDSIEHGNFMDDECIALLSDAQIPWIPTVAITGNILASGRYNPAILQKIHTQQMHTITAAYRQGVLMALGSDAGAYCVPHPQGIFDEYQYFKKAIPDDGLDALLKSTEIHIQNTFKVY